ncbi:MAG: CoA-binding protein [Burkholderiales bacterium]|jgi:predicted CoA-binding protein|nr:CoA-binding protein [Burkholderiaceae bacterium]NBS80663.1 CoA-binding protein [Betaproteobacteria bacterium]NBU00020.1 CoA-binding protein [Betaproteobacteria bacterium]NCX02054.1 CoA-binding protein [Betaproteobacteria bacterium]NDE30395.1 CoA-binding protein [Betaproteobacteria bacterium]
MASIQELRSILTNCKTIAVVGISEQWHRPSYFVGKYLLEHGYRMIPVNPRYKEVLGQTCYPDLESVPTPIDMVDVFRRSEELMPIAKQTLVIGAKVLWQQLTVCNHEAHDYVRERGLTSVMDRCVKIEHARLFGGLNWMGVNTGMLSAKRPRQLPY